MFRAYDRDPVLSPLQNNGGPTRTMALGPGGATLDAADDAISAVRRLTTATSTGITRPQRRHCDIGTSEAMPPHAFLPIIMR